MNYSCNSTNKISPVVVEATPAAAQLNRRRFMRMMTVGAGALAVQACGGGGSAGAATSPQSPITTPLLPPAPAPAPTAPVTAPSQPPIPPALTWASIPTLSFTQGVPSSILIGQYIAGEISAAAIITLNQLALPPGVVFNSINRSFDYDGIGAVNTTDGHVLNIAGS